MQLTMENTDLKLEYLCLDHAHGLCDLYRIVFRKEVTEDYFKIKYGLFDSKRIQCATVAIIKGKIIGFYGAIFTEFCDFNKEKTLSLVNTCDYILLEEFRGKGVLDHLYLHSLAEMKRQKIDFVYGFHSVQTHKFSQKFEWIDGRHFKRFHLSLFPKIGAQVLNKLGCQKVLRNRLEKALNPFLSNRNFNSLNLAGENYTQRYTKDFFKMKEFCPHYLIEIDDVVLWLKYDYVITVGFVELYDKASAKEVLMKLKKILKRVGIFELVFHVQDGTKEFNWLSKSFKAHSSFKISYLRLSDCDALFDDVKLNLMDMDIF